MSDCNVRFLGHSTVVIDLDGQRFITDPILKRWVSGLVHRHPVKDFSVVDGVQAILISHLHHDHLDVPSLRSLPREATLLAPIGSADVLRKRGIPSTTEVREADVVSVGPVRVIATHAQHFGYRAPFGPHADSLGFILEGSQRVYFAGDTAVFPGMRELGAIDLALLPVAGWGPRLGPGHMDPRQAVQALQMIQPRVAVPIHWGSLAPLGMHVRAWPYLTQPPHAFVELASEAIPEVEVRVLNPGESLEL